jgi:hypothetical protein
MSQFKVPGRDFPDAVAASSLSESYNPTTPIPDGPDTSPSITGIRFPLQRTLQEQRQVLDRASKAGEPFEPSTEFESSTEPVSAVVFTKLSFTRQTTKKGGKALYVQYTNEMNPTLSIPIGSAICEYARFYKEPPTRFYLSTELVGRSIKDVEERVDNIKVLRGFPYVVVYFSNQIPVDIMVCTNWCYFSSIDGE